MHIPPLRIPLPPPPPAVDHAAAVLMAATLSAASAAERTARNHRDGFASTEALILASDAAFHAARRAERAAEASGCPAMAAAAHRARCAYRAGGA